MQIYPYCGCRLSPLVVYKWAEFRKRYNPTALLYPICISTNEKPENKFDSGWYTEGQVEYQLETNWLKGAKFANFRPISKFEG